MTLVILGIGLAVVVAVFVYRRVQQAKRAAAEKATRDEAARRQAAMIRAAELERVRQAEQRQAEELKRWHAKRAHEREKALANRVDFELGPQEEASREAAVTCPHHPYGDLVPAFLADGGAALILKFNAPWAELFSRKHYPIISGSVTCVCGKKTPFDLSTRSMVWRHQMWCGEPANCAFCERRFDLNLTTHGPTGLLLYICPDLDPAASAAAPVEIMVDNVGFPD
jgi:ABC-type multidrug transport system fused ATPase/permease subunit